MEAWIEHRIDIINTLHTKGFLVMSKVIFFLFMFTYSFLHANTQILIIHSYHESYPWSANQDKGFKQALDKEKELYPLYSTEYLDTKRRGIDKDYEEEVVHYMTAKYKGYQPKLIYTTDDDAFSFMLHNKERLFPSVPLVFSGVNDLSKRDMISGKTYSGIFEEKDISTNIKLIKTLFPQEKEIMLVGDNSTTASVIEKKFINKFKRSGLKIHSIHGKDYQSTLQQLKRFKGKIVTLTTVGGFKTINGHLVPLKQAIKEIKDVGDFIAIALEDTYIQQGVIGGFVNNGKVQGKEAGEVALDILKAPALKLPESILGVRNFMFDIKALDQLEIILPEEIAQKSQFINQPESFVHKYERVLLISIYGLIAVILFGSLYFTWYMYGSRKTILEKGESLAVITESMDKAQAIAHLGHWDWNIKNNSLWWSDEIYRIFGLEPQEFEATYEAFMSRVHPEDQEKVNEAVNYALKNESDYHIVHRIVQKDGTQRHVIEEGSLKLDGKGVPVRMIGVVNDITDEFEREQSILLQAEIFNAVQDSIMVHDLEGHFVYLNENAWKSRGYSEEEMLKMTVEELDASEYNNATPDEMKKFIQSIKDEGHVKFKVEHVCKSGKRLPVEIYSKLITLNEKPYILSSVRDITEQKKASDAIEASEKKYRDFVENSMVGIYHTRLSGEILYVNPALVKMLGCTSVDEIIGVNSLKMYNTAQDREKFIHELQKTGRLANYELIVQDINNNPFPIMLSAILEGETLTGMMIDMSELKKSQAEIEKLSKVVEQIDDSVAITDNMGVIRKSVV